MSVILFIIYFNNCPVSPRRSVPVLSVIPSPSRAAPALPKGGAKRKRKIRQELDPLHQKYALRYIVGILSFFSTCTCTVYLPLNDGHEHNFLYLSFIILLSLSLPLSPSLSLSLSLPPSLSLFLSALWLQS